MAKRSRSARRTRRPKSGASPGTLVISPDAGPAPIRIFRYTETEFEEATVASPEACRPFLAKPGVCWMDLESAPDAATLEGFRALLDLHPLAVADAANVPQRPKHETYANFDFIVMRMLIPSPEMDGLHSEQMSLFLGERWVLTVQEDEPGDCLEPVRVRIKEAVGSIRKNGADYLAYALVDAVVDGYFPMVEAAFDHLEQLETDMAKLSGKDALRRLHHTRRQLLQLRRFAWPMREALLGLTRDEVGRFTPNTRVYLRDCYDHAVQVLELVETSREVATGLVDLHLSLVGFRTNEVMKVLTIISTIFLPLSFIAGVYGMNFDVEKPGNMPELSWAYGYLFSLAVMAACALGMLVFFRRKGWLGGTQVDETDEPLS